MTLFHGGILVGFVGVQNAAPVEWLQLSSASSAILFFFFFFNKCMPYIEFLSPNRYAVCFCI